MPSKERRAKELRVQAEDMRKLAARARNAEVKDDYLRLAREYEKLAAEVERG